MLGCLPTPPFVSVVVAPLRGQALLTAKADVNAVKRGVDGKPDMTPLDVVNRGSSETLRKMLLRAGGKMVGTTEQDRSMHYRHGLGFIYLSGKSRHAPSKDSDEFLRSCFRSGE